MNQEKLSPGMQQYLELKMQYQDAFLLFRMGDFYELFYEDAVKAAQLLELTLTSRNKNSENPIPMAGVPHHAVQNYIDTLVELGFKVAIAEQMKDLKQTKGVVRREVVQVITPGTMMSGKDIKEKANNYLCAVLMTGARFGFAYTDLSTGEFKVSELSTEEEVLNEACVLQTKEMVLASPISENLRKNLKQRLQLVFSEQFEMLENAETNFLIQDLCTPSSIEVAKKLLTYLQVTQKRNLGHLQKAKFYQVEHFLKMDHSSRIHLELIKSFRSGKKHGSLLWLLDETKTAMGGRRLREWIMRPLISVSEISARQAMISCLLQNFFERADLQESLKGVYDLERLAARVSFGTINPRELLQLHHSLLQIPRIRTILGLIDSGEFKSLLTNLMPNQELQELIVNAIDDEAPIAIKEGGIIKEGYNEELDRYRKALKNGSHWILELEQKERQLTGIKNLRIDYNRKDGYYFHVTNSNLSFVPKERYFRKATLKNADRFGTQELEELQSTILEATEKSVELEYELFLDVRAQVEEYIEHLQQLGKAISDIDVLQSLASVAERYHYVQPEIFGGGQEVKIEDGRHPVVEKVLGEQEYIPNSIEMSEKTQILLLTGPNMSGKSTYMRQFALMVVMAQIGSFVPAKSAKLPIFDQIFTRIGASDDLASGQSTFMIEMMEANLALSKATHQSLILFDELGRGTATYDGMALAQAIIEHIHQYVGAKTLFSTHYHELTSLAEDLAGLENIHVGAIEQEGELVFLHKIKKGAADKSYGIHVAKIAGLPKVLLNRAEEVLQVLEKMGSRNEEILINSNGNSYLVEEDESFFETQKSQSEDAVLECLRQLDILMTNPIEALKILSNLKEKLGE